MYNKSFKGETFAIFMDLCEQWKLPLLISTHRLDWGVLIISNWQNIDCQYLAKFSISAIGIFETTFYCFETSAVPIFAYALFFVLMHCLIVTILHCVDDYFTSFVTIVDYAVNVMCS